MAYHHFGSITDMTHILAGFLKPNGALIIADRVKGGQPKKPLMEPLPGWEHGVAHMSGFDEAEIRGVFEGAGLGEFTFNPEIRVGEGDQLTHLFVAKGVKL